MFTINLEDGREAPSKASIDILDVLFLVIKKYTYIQYINYTIEINISKYDM